MNFPQFVVIHTVKGFCILNETEVDAFLEFSFFIYNPTDVGYLTYGSSAFSKSSLYAWKSLIHVLLKPSLKDSEHYLPDVRNEQNCVIVLTFFDFAFIWIGLKLNFSSPVATAELSKFVDILSETL